MIDHNDEQLGRILASLMAQKPRQGRATCPDEETLDLVQMVKAIVERLVGPCGGVGRDGVPQLGVGPELMSEKVVQERVHARRLL